MDKISEDACHGKDGTTQPPKKRFKKCESQGGPKIQTIKVDHCPDAQSSSSKLLPSIMMESNDSSDGWKQRKQSSLDINQMKQMDKDQESSSDAESDEWQEVEDIPTVEFGSELEKAHLLKQDDPNEKTVEVSIDVPGSSSGKESRGMIKYDWAKHVQWQVNRYNKALQLQIHKVHLLCLLASALQSSEMCNNTELQARSLSQVPMNLVREASSMCSFDLSWIAELLKWLSTSYKFHRRGDRGAGRPTTMALAQCIEKMSADGVKDLIHVALVTLRGLGLQARLIQSLQPVSVKYTMLCKVSSKQSSQKANLSDKPTTSNRSKEGHKKVTEKSSTFKPRQQNRISKKGMVKKSVKGNNSAVQDRNTRTASTALTVTDMSSDSDFEENGKAKMSQQSSLPPLKKPKRTTRKILSSDSEDDDVMDCLSTGCDNWIEVYSPSDKRWICVDCIGGHINRPDLCEQNATKPLCYVVAVDNENRVKDVTKRYASKWMFETEKLRVQSGWWEDTLKPYCTKHIMRDTQEDEQLNKQLQEKPLPSSISEYKNHHLYVLKRHLLKFEALHPESPAILGYCRGEAVYSRDCVHTLHTRETWLKQGLTIRPGEKPYKTVKARPRKNKSFEPALPLYGKWQTELYIPPPAVDGKVPRNEYGNVELFQPSMLPMGTVHLQIPGLYQSAQKLGIDCAPAMVGWDYHRGFCHPVLDGYVVCSEFRDILLDTWQKDQTEKDNKIKRKREQDILKKWKILVNGVLIKERITKRFQKSSQ